MKYLLFVLLVAATGCEPVDSDEDASFDSVLLDSDAGGNGDGDHDGLLDESHEGNSPSQMKDGSKEDELSASDGNDDGDASGSTGDDDDDGKGTDAGLPAPVGVSGDGGVAEVGVGATVLEITDTGEPISVDPVCYGMPKAGSGVNWDGNPRPAAIGRDGYVFVNAGYTRDPIDRETSRTQRCDVATGTVESWANYEPDPEFNSTRPTRVGASAGNGALYGFNYGLEEDPDAWSEDHFVKTVDGEVVWADNYDEFFTLQLGSEEAVQRVLHSGGPEAPVYVITKAGQLPGEAPDLNRRPLLVKYSSEGERLSMTRLDGRYTQWGWLAKDDPSGNVYLTSTVNNRPSGAYVTHVRAQKLDPEGHSVWEREVPTVDDTSVTEVRAMAASDAGVFFLVKGNYVPETLVPGNPAGTTNVAHRSLQLVKLDSDGNLVFNLELFYDHLEVVDPAEYIEWHGILHPDHPPQHLAALDAGGVCLGGQYENHFVNGAVHRDPYVGALVSCFDADGKPLWTHQYRSTYIPEELPNADRVTALGAIREQDNGNLVISADTGQGAGTVIFVLDSDGTPL